MSPCIRLAFRSLSLLAALLAFSTLSAADPPPEVTKLIAQLKDPNEGVRLKAAKDLGKLKGEAKAAVEALAKVAESDPDEDVRSVAKKALAAIRESVAESDTEKDKEVVAPLLKTLKSKKAGERISALEQLTTLGERARPATSAIVEAMMDPAEAVREKAAGCLEKVDPAIHKHAVSILYDKAAAKQADAMAQLGQMGARAKGAVPLLKWRYATPTQYSSTGPGRVWYEALEAMAEIVPDDALTVNEVLRLVALPPSMPRVRDQTSVARGVGLKLLNTIDAPKAKKVAALTTALAEPAVRVDVIGRLGKLGADAKPALPALMKLKLDSNAAVREAATKAIESITAE